jgi:hypothetical protein
MNAAALSFFLTWWIGVLLNALLRPSFVRYRCAKAAGDEVGAQRYLRFFDGLLFSCDCYPYGVSMDRFGLWITLDGPDYFEDYPDSGFEL